jgi:hypothetical protein
MNKPLDFSDPTRALRRQSRRWVDEEQETMAMGCPGCIEFGPCGGIFTKQQGVDCLANCCGKPEDCQSACPRNLREYQRRMREMNTFDLANIPRHAPIARPNLPTFVPLIYHGNSHRQPLELDAAAIFFHELYRRRDGSLRLSTRAEIEKRFGLAPGTKIILVGSGPDAPIEAWWGLSARRREIIQFFVDQGFELATSPNYSLFTDVPRFDDLYNIKKVAKAWQEFGDCGQACALHINARTRRDYERFAEFVAERAEITNVSVEFGTGAGYPTRMPYHRRYLAALGRTAPRSLHLTMVGGVNAIPMLAAAFNALTFIDTSAFINAVQRQRLYLNNHGKIEKVDVQTEEGAPLDELLRSNIQIMRNRIEKLVTEARSVPPARYTGPTPRIPGRKPSGQAARSLGQAELPKLSARDRRSENADSR